MSAMGPTPYSDLNAVLSELVRGVQAVLAGHLVGAYLQGSFAVGDFDRDSDVDWIVVIDGELQDDTVAALQGLHERLYSLACPWAQHLEGSYFPRDTLRDHARRATPLWYLDHGSRSLIRDAHDNTVVVRWVLREHGVILAGPAPATLVDPIPVDALRRQILEVMLGWWRQIEADPRSIDNRFYQGFAVLSYCRMLHDLRTGRCGSKRAGADWARAALDPRWRGLIDRAWLGRPDPARSVRTPADPLEFERTLQFIRYVITTQLTPTERGEHVF